MVIFMEKCHLLTSYLPIIIHIYILCVLGKFETIFFEENLLKISLKHILQKSVQTAAGDF